MYILKTCRWVPYGVDPELDLEVDATWWGARRRMAERGYGLDKLVYDVHPSVRAAVAEQGYGLDVLLWDKDADVRCEVAANRFGLGTLIADPNLWVRAEVAHQGYGLNQLINDKEFSVRRSVARQGYGLDKLINDDDGDVRCAVKDYLKKHNLTFKQWIEQNPDKCVLKHNDQIEKVTKDFIYKIDESNKLEVQSQYDSIDDFFNSSISDDTKMNRLVIYSIDTKIPLFKIEKVQNETIDYKFIVDITTDKDENFSIKTIIQTQNQLTKLIQQTVDYLRNYVQFSKYADDLENCL